MGASIIAKLLGWIGLPQWALELIAVGLIAGGILFSYIHVYEKGKVAEHAAELDKVNKANAVLAARVTTAEHSHDQELSDLQSYRDAHPEQPVRLCLKPAAVRTPAAVAGSSGAAPGVVQQVPAGDNLDGPGSAGPDISGLLEALAARADQVSAELRTRQGIEP